MRHTLLELRFVRRLCARTNTIKNGHHRLYLALLLLGAVPAPLMSQASFQGIGTLPGATSSHANDVSPEGEYVVGASGTLPVIWSASMGLQAMGAENGGAVGVSFGGAAACGTLSGVLRQAFYWTPSGGLVPLGALPGGSTSQAFDISDSGNVVVGDAASTAGSQGYAWTPGGGMTGLGDLPGGSFFSSAEGISGDGRVVVGWSRSVDNTGEAFRWTAGGGMTGLGFLPGFTSSVARAASFDGSVIVGSSTVNTASGQIIEATMWSGGSISGLGRLPGGNASIAYGVSDDGRVVVGHASAPSASVAFIWDATNGIRSLKDALESEYGLDLSGWTLTMAYRVSSDGRVIVGYGTNPSGQNEGWRAVLDQGTSLTIISPVANETLGILTDFDILWASSGIDSLRVEYSTDDGQTYFLVAANVPADSNKYTWEVPPTPSDSCRLKLTDIANSDVFEVSRRFRIGDAITITSPEPGERWIAGEPDTIRWQSNGVDSIRILFSREYQDLNSPFDTLAVNYPAGSGFFAWEIPDDILSAKCALVIDDMQDAFVFSEPRKFKIKGYVLTRLRADSTYEAFDPAVHGWNFGNAGRNMWPDTWYQQFDYANGTDPFTGEAYPFWYTTWPYSAQPSDFPDWPLFVSTFGVDQCYVNDSGTLSHRFVAATFWSARKGAWGGSCYGFATSAFLAFDRREVLRAVYPELPGFTNTVELPLNEFTRAVINELMIHQYGNTEREYHRENRNKTPEETLNEIKAMLLSETGDNHVLVISDNTPVTGGAHAINPYRIEKEPLNPDIEYVYVYDNNAPGFKNRRIVVDKAAGTWDYSILNNWGGKPEEGQRFYLSLPASATLSNAILPGSSPNIQPAAAKTARDAAYISTYHSDVTSIILTNPRGEQVGFSQESTIESVPDAFPLVPITGYPHPPIGYDLPADAYTVEMQGHSASTSYFSVVTDTLYLSYGYTDADTALRDHLHIGDGLAVCYKDQRTKTANFQAIVIDEQGERAFDLSNCDLSQDDSLHFSVSNRRDLNVVNVGTQKSYDLRLRSATAVGSAMFEHSNISLAPNTSHRIAPGWGDFATQPLTIYIDKGNDGAVDDSLSLVNQTTSVEGSSKPGTPGNWFLYQNYPNPFNPRTTISFALPRTSHVALTIYDLLGRKVATLVDERVAAGVQKIVFDGSELPSGVYLYRIEAEGFHAARKLLLLK